MTKLANIHTEKKNKGMMLLFGGLIIVFALLVAFFMVKQSQDVRSRADEPPACVNNLRKVSCAFKARTTSAFMYEVVIVQKIKQPDGSMGRGISLEPIIGTHDGDPSGGIIGIIVPNEDKYLPDSPDGYDCIVTIKTASVCSGHVQSSKTGSCTPPKPDDTPTPLPPANPSPTKPLCKFGPCPIDPDTGYKYTCDFEDCSGQGDGKVGCPRPQQGHCKPKVGGPCNPGACFECAAPELRDRPTPGASEGLKYLKCYKYNPSDNTCSLWDRCEVPSPTITPPDTSLTPTKPFCPVANKVAGVCL